MAWKLTLRMLIEYSLWMSRTVMLWMHANDSVLPVVGSHTLQSVLCGRLQDVLFLVQSCVDRQRNAASRQAFYYDHCNFIVESTVVRTRATCCNVTGCRVYVFYHMNLRTNVLTNLYEWFRHTWGSQRRVLHLETRLDGAKFQILALVGSFFLASSLAFGPTQHNI